MPPKRKRAAKHPSNSKRTATNAAKAHQEREEREEEREQVFSENRKEKLEEFEFQTRRLKCRGCSENCPLNLIKLRQDLHKIIDDEDEADRVFVSILEWDHKDPLKKTRHVSSIMNKQKRLKEIAKCQLFCLFCHRFKTYVNGDGIMYKYGSNTPRRVTRQRLKTILGLKEKRLQEQGSNGVCPGPMEGTECPFKDDFESFRTTINAKKYNTDLSSNEMLLLLYDFDHQNIADKLDVLHNLRIAEQDDEAKKCNVKCCLCHRWKTVVMKDYVCWVALRHGSDEECREARHLFEGELLERDDGEWRMSSF